MDVDRGSFVHSGSENLSENADFLWIAMLRSFFFGGQLALVALYLNNSAVTIYCMCTGGLLNVIKLLYFFSRVEYHACF